MPSENEQFKVDLIADAKDIDLKIQQGNKKLAQFSKESAERGMAKIRVNIAKFQSDLDTARAELRKFKKEGDKAGELQTRLKIQGLQENVSNAKKQLKGLQEVANGTKKSFFSLGQGVKDLIKGFSALYVIQRAIGWLKGAKDEAIAFESAFAGVRKTVDATEKEFKQLERGIVQLSKEIPLTVEELSRIGELAGQLGVAKDDILDFTKTIAGISVATNLTQEESATAFARIANIYQEPIANVENLASSVVDLGNNFATTEKEIVNFATRIAGSGKIVGLTTADIVAIGTAFSSVGVEAEAGGTAVQKTLISINDAVSKGGEELQNFASLTGQSADEFAKKWKADPAKAFNDFVVGLANSGDKGSQILEELVAGDQRLKRAFLSLAGAGDLLSRAIDKSSDAYQKNTALIEEAEKKYATSEGRLQILDNRFADFRRTIGALLATALIPLLTGLVKIIEALNGMINVVISSINYVRKAMRTFEDMGTAGKVLTKVIEALSIAIGILAGTKLLALIGIAPKVIGAMASIATAIKGVNLALLATPVGLTISLALVGVAGVIAGITKVQRKIASITKQSEDYIDSSKKRMETEQEVVRAIEKENERLEKSKDKNAQAEIKRNNELIKISKARIAQEASQQAKANAEIQKANLNLFNDFSGKKREEASLSQETADKQIAYAQELENKIIEGLDNEAGERYNNFREAVKQQEDLADVTEENQNDLQDLFGSTAGSVKKGSKEAEEALGKYEDAIKETEKATKELAENTADYYEDIAEVIDDAKKKQRELKQELEDFTQAESEQFLRDSAERQVELVGEEEKVRNEIAEAKKEEVKTSEEQERKQEKINELNKELNEILAERNEIQSFIDTTGAGDLFSGEVERATERANASQFGLAKLDLEEKLKLKQEEIQAEIDKQQKILDIQQQFYDLQNAQGAEAEEKRKQLDQLVENSQELSPEERKQQLLELGFAELDAEGQIELLKQAERFKNLEVERKRIEEQQKDILETKEEYFKLAEEAHKESTDEMIKQTDELIARINQAIQAQLRLRALGGSPVPAVSGSTTNVNVTNNNANGVDAESAILRLVDKINQ